jgi:hypothetical protein
MPRDIQSLLHRAVPRLKKGDAKAEKLEAKIAKLGTSLWNKGPRGLRKIGVKLEADDHREFERDELFEGAREILGDKEFVRFVRKVKDVLQRKLADKKASSDGTGSTRSKRSSGRSSGRKRRERSGRRKREPDPEPVEVSVTAESEPKGPDLTLSGSDGVDVPAELTLSGSDELEIPDESGEGLVVPDESDGGLVLPDEDLGDEPEGVPDLEEFDLDNLELEVGATTTSGGGAEASPAVFEDAPKGDDPARDGDRALARYARTGDPANLKEARSLFKQAMKKAKGPVAKGAVCGGLARVYFLQGELEKATDMATKALKAFPHEPVANAVICQAGWPKEVEREKLRALLARADSALSTSDYDEIKAAAKVLAKEYPKAPHAPLLILAIDCDKLQDDLEGLIKKAWKRYPAEAAYADLPLGPRLERVLVEGCLRWLEKTIEEDQELRGKTVKDTENKANAISGAVQMALGISRAAICSGRKASALEKQQMILWIGRSLYFAQYYDHAKEVFAKAQRLDRESDLIGELRKQDTACGVMKRAFERPGVKFKKGSLDGVGLVRYREAVAGRLKQVLSDLEGDRTKLDTKEARIVDAILADPKRKKKLQGAAKKAEVTDPFAAWDALEAEAAAAPAEPAAKKKGGLLGRMKAAAKGAIDKAKSAAQGAAMANRRKAARRAMGEHLRDGPDKGWGDKALDSFLAKASLIEPRLDYLESLAEDLRSAAGRAGDY